MNEWDSVHDFCRWVAFGFVVLVFGWLILALSGPPRNSCYLGNFEENSHRRYNWEYIREQMRLQEEQRERGNLSDGAYGRVRDSIFN